ncbi:hypothetical protein ACFO4L_06880 [Bacillus daqingensis]|uniref:Uncharacterized protein n=1 Tax=Bacillus daqingensis TaxID=872396 RepID=A0ABV9NVM4_9BACI
MVQESQVAFSIASEPVNYPEEQLKQALLNCDTMQCYLSDASCVMQLNHFQNLLIEASRKKTVHIYVASDIDRNNNAFIDQLHRYQELETGKLKFQTLIVTEHIVYFERKEQYPEIGKTSPLAHTYYSNDEEVVNIFAAVFKHAFQPGELLKEASLQKQVTSQAEAFRGALTSCIHAFEGCLSAEQQMAREQLLAAWREETKRTLELHADISEVLISFSSDTTYGADFLTDILQLNQSIADCQELLCSEALIELSTKNVQKVENEGVIHAELIETPDGVYDHLIGSDEEEFESESYMREIELMLKELQDSARETNFQTYPAHLYLLDRMLFVSYYLHRIIVFLKYE